jgi:carbamoyl-phosphate synthase large subunit
MSRSGDPSALAVLVTGVGGHLGMSILKALRQSALRPRIVGTDARPISIGLFCADASYLMPHVAVDEAAYIRRLKEICKAEAIDMVCFGSETELERVAPYAEEIEADSGAKPMVLSPAALERMMDKWEMVQHLRTVPGLPWPDTTLASDDEATRALVGRHGFPLVLKPRRGTGSKHVSVVRDEAQLEGLRRLVPDAIVQEYLLPDDEEYTVGTYTSPRTGYVGEIIFRRVLDAGGTYKAEVVEDDEIAAVCRRAVEGDDVWGPVNLQLRKTAHGVCIFEMNPRFSGSVTMRAHFGFNELDMALLDIVLGQDVPRPRVRKGYGLRYLEEIYLEPGEYPAEGSAPFEYPHPGTRVGRISVRD